MASRGLTAGPRLVSYDEAVELVAALGERDEVCYPSVFLGSTPEAFRRHVCDALATLPNRPRERRLLFVKSWNEWRKETR